TRPAPVGWSRGAGVAAFLEFALPYGQTVSRDVLKLKRQGFRDSHAGGRKKAEEGRIHQWPDRACWLQLCRGLHQLGNLIRPVDVWSSPFEHPTPQGIGRRHLMADIFGLHRQREAPECEEPIPALGRRWRSCGPVERAIDANELVGVRLSEADEIPEQRMLAAELEAQGAVEVDISRQVLAQHDASPGQSCAICRRLVMSTLA